MEANRKRFAEVVDSLVHHVALKKGGRKKYEVTETEIAAELHVSQSTIQTWRQGRHIPADREAIAAKLARIGVRHHGMSRSWTNALLTSLAYSHRDLLLAELFPNHAGNDNDKRLPIRDFAERAPSAPLEPLDSAIMLQRPGDQRKAYTATGGDSVRVTRTERSTGTQVSLHRSAAPVPMLVPPLPPQGIFGRQELVEHAARLLVQDQGEPEQRPPVALLGMGGIGKTTIAIALGHHSLVRQTFPDGILWASIGPKPSLRNVLDDWGRALSIELTAERDETACSLRLRSALHDRRMLVIADDLWDIKHGAPLAIAGPQCCLLFTTRESPIAHALATRTRTLRVDILQPEAAHSLLRRLATEAVSADARSTQRLCDRLEYLPLALTLAGRMLANEADTPHRMQRLVAELIERRDARLHLLQEEGRLGFEGSETVSLQSILGMSVERLSALDQRRFALLGVFGAEPLVWELEAAAHVWECSHVEAEETVSRFVQRGLVTRRDSQYWLHALLADYAGEMLERL